MPSASMARVEGQTAVDQAGSDIDILAKVSKGKGSERENVRVVGAKSKCLSSKIDTGEPDPFRATASP